MRNPLTRYTLLAKRWAWLILLGIFLCGGSTYIITKLMQPVYQATALVLVSFNTSNSVYDNTTAALEILPTYVQLVNNPAVLQPVLAQHKGLTLKQLIPMISAKPQYQTQLIELDVTNTDPQLAAQLANEVGQSLAQYSNMRLNATVEVLPAIVPSDPIQPKPSRDALLGALVGFGLALALIVVFEWVDDRIANPEEIQELLGMGTLTIIPHLSRNQRVKNVEDTPALAEGCRILSATINTAHQRKPFKLVMVTSALAREGKSTIAANLASFLAISGKRVLLVDADLRHPVLDQHFQLDNHQGLYNVFLEIWAKIQVDLEGQPTEIETLRVLTAGVSPSNPAELLQSQLAGQLFEHFKRSSFDYIIFDTPPLLPVADTQILASYMDAIVLVVDVSKTPRKILTRAGHILRRTPATLLGVTVNKSHWPDYWDIRDYLNSIQHQRHKADIPLSILPYTPPDIPIANSTSTFNEQRAKDSKDMLTAPNERAAVPHTNRVHLESVSSEQKLQTDRNTTPRASDISQSTTANEHNDSRSKADTAKLPSARPNSAKLPSLNTTDANYIPADSSITTSIPQKRTQ